MPQHGRLLVIGVRHGTTEGNEEGVLRAWADMVLDSQGKLDAQLAARKLTGYDPKFVYHSDLTRDTQTAQIIAEYFAIPSEPDFGLRTADMGTWTEQPEEAVRDLVINWYMNPWTRAGGGGDTCIGFEDRFFACFDQKLEQAELDSYNPIVTTMHGRNFAALHSRYTNTPRWEAEMPFPGGIALIRSNAPNFPQYTIEFLGKTEPVCEDK